jgi:Ca-activated chloride channel family protein
VQQPMVGNADATTQRHLVLALDVSPSMYIEDAGPLGKQKRADRAREVLRSVLERLDLRQTLVSIVAFYGEARPVVVDTFDPEVIANVLDDLPLEHAFAVSKTNLYESVNAAADVSKSWRAGSAALVIISDGDTLPPKATPQLPRAYSDLLVLGVGDPYRGEFIDGHVSHQDKTSLEQLALQLHGDYFDVNARHVPSDRLLHVAASMPTKESFEFGRREIAVASLCGGACWLAFAGPLLALAGGAWRHTRARPVESFTFYGPNDADAGDAMDRKADAQSDRARREPLQRTFS